MVNLSVGVKLDKLLELGLFANYASSRKVLNFKTVLDERLLPDKLCLQFSQ